MVRPRIAILGTGSEATYHPLAPLEAELTRILAPLGVPLFLTDRDAFLSSIPEGLGLLVLLSDDWEKPADDEGIAGLVSWVAKGGDLLVLHQGISLQARSEFATLVGARFTRHPEATVLAFTPLGPLEGLGPWEMHDEPYRFEFDPLAALSPLLEYRDAEGVHPAGWERRYCLGRIAYLAPGHAAANYACAAYARLVAAVAARMLG
jgi:type 1 glutamine amidotransferase